MDLRKSRKSQTRSVRKGFVVFIISLIACSSTAIAITKNFQERSKALSQHSLPINEIIIFSDPPPEELLPMPIGKIDVASSTVESKRNPFEEPSSLESINLDVLNSAIKFSGIAKSANSLVALIKTDQGYKAYKVGDSLGNGFFVKAISKSDVTVDISNGLRNYRLSLKILKK